jgi:tetratricopeptide (TPR) repeat protein
MKFECVIMKRFVLSFIYPLALLTAIHPIASTTARSAVVTEATTMGERPPPLLLDGVSHDRREITTGSDEARRWFNQGLELLYGFNHDEAIRSFQQAAEHDPESAMPWWGIAYARGPHINNLVMTEEQSRLAHEAVREAVRRIGRASPVEQALIGAITTRYAMPFREDRTELDQNFAAAMERVWEQFPNDPDVGALFAESMMTLQPWDLWTRSGEPKGRAQEIVDVLERVLELDAQHPGANHFYIHAVEASPEPERALEAAKRLENLVPGAGHLVHMPAHIYARLGKWARASDANVVAIDVDRAYFKVAPQPGFYTIYYLHNMHFLAWSAMMEGRYEKALEAARGVEQAMPEALLRQMAFVADGFMPVTYHVLIRFGEWEKILDEPEPEDSRHVSRAHWRYARALAQSNLGRQDQARQELESFEREAARIPDHWEISFNNAREVIQIARLMAQGEIAYHEGRPDTAFEALREAVTREDALRYAEPPAWMHPVRHALGALLLAEGRLEESEEVYRRDLEKYPRNGWALLGLQQVLLAQGRTDEAEVLAPKLQVAWARADVQPPASCYCHPDAQEARRHQHGIVEFPVSGNDEARRAIETGLAHLHHMMYEQARPHFEAAAKADPECAMAHWGIAMTSFQPLWHPASKEGLQRGKAAVDAALAIGAPTEREQAYIAAVAAFFDDPEPPAPDRTKDHQARVTAWKEAQRRVHEAYLEDVDAAAFYALAEVCYATTQFSPDQERDYTRERRAGALLARYLEEHPRHPGLFHYLIHAYDSTKLALKAEAVARDYAQLAPDSPHALHMPSHIFVRLGHWKETVEWNERSADAALRLMDTDPHASAHYVHALDYMMYGYLQLGEETNARETLDRIRQLDEIWLAPFAGYNTAATQVRYYLEQQKWEEAAQLEPRTPRAIPWDDFPAGEALFHYARGLGAARSGALDEAGKARERIAGCVAALREDGNVYWAHMTDALGKAVEAWILYARGETEDALALMSKAADLEDSMDKHPTTPGEVLPVRELYAELLLKEERAAEALQAFQASLERTPNRRNALLGLERAGALQTAKLQR